jgi:hypothetical protein
MGSGDCEVIMKNQCKMCGWTQPFPQLSERCENPRCALFGSTCEKFDSWHSQGSPEIKYKDATFEDNLLKHREVIEKIVREMEVSASYDEAHFNRYTMQDQRIGQLEESENFLATRYDDLLDELKGLRETQKSWVDWSVLNAIIAKYKP